ncbi:prealbumin-like fold domain-containing protein [Methanolapillus millepedarum]|uniref:GLUG domain-containing protein n=1 Tax=Methanolapillus millepedarum TaxID=3028296 RepID=A0AA97A4I8_9EURY|nr:hypothetical protein MsAc7_14330 [Methanosarcinaceae archaeon Ac7]
MAIKSLFLTFIIFSVLLLLCGTAAAATSVSTVSDLENISSVANLSGDYILTQNLIIPAGTWASIGNNTNPFIGNFNGNNYTITFAGDTAFTNDMTANNGYGLFGNVNGSANISNLNINVSGNLTIPADSNRFGVLVGRIGESGTVLVSNCSITATGNYSILGNASIGGLAGYMGNGTVKNSSSNIHVKTAGNNAGGFIGEVYNGVISNSYSMGNVNGKFYVGGFIGTVWEADVANCYATGNVNGMQYAGGLVGLLWSGNVLNCYASGAVDSNYQAGGLVGLAYEGNVSECYATGDIFSATDCAGGLFGQFEGNISESYATGNVTAVQNGSGGIAGAFNGTMEKCYATGTTNGINFVGGLVGDLHNGTISECYATGSVIASGDYAGGLVGLNEGWIASVYQISDSYALNKIVTGNENVGRIYGNYSLLGPTPGLKPITITNTYAWENMSGDFDGNPADRGIDISSTEVWQTYPAGTVWSNLDSTVWKQNSFSSSNSYNYRLPILNWQTEILEEDASHLRPKVSPGGGTGGATVIPQNNTAEVKGYESSSSGAILILETVDSSNASKKLTATYELKDANGNSFNPKMIYITNQSGHAEQIFLTNGITYTIYETKASEGYQPLNGSIKIVVNDDLTVQPVLGYNLTQNGGVYTLTIPNSPETAPDNGNKSWFGTWWWLILFILILIIAVAGYWYYKNSSSKSKK